MTRNTNKQEAETLISEKTKSLKGVKKNLNEGKKEKKEDEDSPIRGQKAKANCSPWEKSASLLTGNPVGEKRGGFRRIEVEGDALSIIKKTKSKEEDRSVLRAYMMEIKELEKGFKECHFKKISKSGNEAAHALAREGLKRQPKTYLDDWWPEAKLRASESDGRRMGRLERVIDVLSLQSRWRDSLLVTGHRDYRKWAWVFRLMFLFNFLLGFR
ncbi:hypothetical protein PVK06_003878 [Gossypium arboreum]|uniref:RNase H type-1 domain-containing protein n=1 Tax=Gossypium arboreum TaxID=29729 RepID=A0ABR0QQH8_GOSAR|nr:hypothetical protein PVK06_003878 [Gossypium arboreum]